MTRERDRQAIAELLDGDRRAPRISFWCWLRLHPWEKWSEVQRRDMRRTHKIGGVPVPERDFDFVQEFQRRACSSCGEIQERILDD